MIRPAKNWYLHYHLISYVNIFMQISRVRVQRQGKVSTMLLTGSSPLSLRKRSRKLSLSLSMK